MRTKKQRTQCSIQQLTLCFHALKSMEASANTNDNDNAALYRSYCTEALKELKALGFDVDIPGFPV